MDGKHRCHIDVYRYRREENIDSISMFANIATPTLLSTLWNPLQKTKQYDWYTLPALWSSLPFFYVQRLPQKTRLESRIPRDAIYPTCIVHRRKEYFNMHRTRPKQSVYDNQTPSYSWFYRRLMVDPYRRNIGDQLPYGTEQEGNL